MDGSDLCWDLGMGTTSADFHSLGSLPKERVCFSWLLCVLESLLTRDLGQLLWLGPGKTKDDTLHLLYTRVVVVFYCLQECENNRAAEVRQNG